MTEAPTRFVDLPSERQLELLLTEMRSWKARGRKTWPEARRFLARAQVLAIALGVQFPDVMDMLDADAHPEAPATTTRSPR